MARRYGFAPKLESASRLTQLVARQDSDLDEIAKVIDKDPALRARLLRVANPDAENEAEYAVETVEDALMRNGIGCVLVLAMGTPLALALIKTFQTMLSLKLENIDRNQADAAGRRASARHHRFLRQGGRPGLSAHEPRLRPGHRRRHSRPERRRR